MFSQDNSHDHHALKPLLGGFVRDVSLYCCYSSDKKSGFKCTLLWKLCLSLTSDVELHRELILSTVLCVQCQENWRVLTGILLRKVMWEPFCLVCYIHQSPKYLGVVKRHRDSKLPIVSLVRSCQDEMKEAALWRKTYWDLDLKEEVMPRDEETSFFDSWGKWKEGDWLGGSLLMMPDFQDNKIEDT